MVTALWRQTTFLKCRKTWLKKQIKLTLQFYESSAQNVDFTRFFAGSESDRWLCLSFPVDQIPGFLLFAWQLFPAEAKFWALLAGSKRSPFFRAGCFSMRFALPALEANDFVPLLIVGWPQLVRMTQSVGGFSSILELNVRFLPKMKPFLKLSSTKCLIRVRSLAYECVQHIGPI